MPDPSQAAPRLFVSYRRTQLAAVQPVVAALTTAGVVCFLDLQAIDPLADFPQRVREGIDTSHAMLVWWSADYGDSDICLAELRRAWQHARRRSSDVGRRVLVLNPEPGGRHVFAGELNAQNFLTPPAAGQEAGWAAALKQRLDALLPEGPLADEHQALPVPRLRDVPVPGAHFTGRGDTLLRLHSQMFPPQVGAAATGPSVWLHGLEGLGKTEAAAKYGRDFVQAYPGGVFWLRLAAFEPHQPVQPAELELAGYRALEGVFAQEPALQAQLLRDAQQQPRPLAEARACVAQWLEQASPAGPYLWVLDNLPLMSPLDARAQALALWAAPTAAGRTLVTTRDARVPDGFAEQTLAALPRDDALRLLARLAPWDLGPPQLAQTERAAAEQLVQAVGGHTLALRLLGERARVDGGYERALAALHASGRLQRLEQLAQRLRKEMGDSVRSLLGIFDMSITPLEAPARQVLALAAQCAANEPIPRRLLREAYAAQHTADTLDDDFADALRALLAASLLEERRAADAVDLHPLVQDVAEQLLQTHAEHEGEAVAAPLVHWLNAVTDIARRDELAAGVVHARRLAPLLKSLNGVRLFNRLGRYEVTCGRYAAALPMEAQAVALARTVLGDEHPETLICINNLADTRLRQGDAAAALALLEGLGPVFERVLGPRETHTLTALGNLGVARFRHGQLAQARSLQQQVLDIRIEQGGEADAEVQVAKTNLANTLAALGEPAAALQLLREALAARQQLLGPDRIETLRSQANLGVALVNQKQFAQAHALLSPAAQGLLRVAGPDHPDTLAPLLPLALCCREVDDPAGAALAWRLLARARGRQLGADHADTLFALNEQAFALKRGGALEQARALYEQVLQQRQRLLGDEHPDTLLSLNNLAATLRALGDLSAARHLYEQLLAARRRLLGEADPQTIAALNHLDKTLAQQNDVAAALALWQALLQGRRDALGEDHPLSHEAAQHVAWFQGRR
jgi:hypothetical protein